jgi:hypothetical protein
LKDDRTAASEILTGPTEVPQVDREQLLKDVRDALYAAKICSYAQGMMLIQAASKTYEWDIDLGTCARIWKGGCIIRAGFLDRITQVRGIFFVSFLFQYFLFYISRFFDVLVVEFSNEFLTRYQSSFSFCSVLLMLSRHSSAILVFPLFSSIQSLPTK